jgi:hypothetical protein
MRYLLKTSYQPCTIKVNLLAKKSCVIYLNAYDSELANTFFLKRFRNFQTGEKNTLYIQMPICGMWTLVEVFSNSQDDFSVLSVEKTGLAKQIDVATLTNQDVKNFIPFAQQFCYNASSLKTFSDRLYVSDKGGFKIMYSEVIADNVITPARINKLTKEIEVSKQKFLQMTVPMRFCILCHEFSHLYLNQDIYNELEADLNGLTIYLGLGYPRYEANETFLQTFYQAPTEENLFGRYQYIEKFINDFETLNITHL